MRKTFSDRVERGRVLYGSFCSNRGNDFGFFHLNTNSGQAIGVLVSSGSEEIPWEHVSVSTRTRCPTWEEMHWVKTLFFDDEESVIQFHPRASQHVNDHPYCLHLWRPLNATIPEPPSIAVGLGPEKHAAEVARLTW